LTPEQTPPIALPEVDDHPVLDIAQLTVSYGHRQVLKQLDLRIEAGAIYGLLGPNGAGKTTLIRTICGRIVPTSGTVSIEGLSNRKKSTLRRIGLVPQEIGLYSHLTVRENLQAFGRLSGMSAAETRDAVKWAEDVTRLSERHGERLDILSGGWKRRVNIAAAILHRPALLILDEPTVGVDVDARNELHEVIRDLTHSGMAVLIATHDLDQAETICSSVGFLIDGTIGPAGPPQALIDAEFAGGTVVIIELRRSLTALQRSALLKAGFSTSNGEMTWSIFGDVGDAVSTALSAQLDRLGISAREIRHRKPGLDTLFLQLTRKPAPEPTS
jgi:ABC-2 type transport system ATP-binding protein